MLNARYTKPEAIEGRTDVVRVRCVGAMRAPWQGLGWDDSAYELIVPSDDRLATYQRDALERNESSPRGHAPTEEQLAERVEARAAFLQGKQDAFDKAIRKAQMQNLQIGTIAARTQESEGISDTRAKAPPAKVSPAALGAFPGRPRAWIDLETSGADPLRHQVLEIGLLVLEADNRTPRLLWSTLVQLGAGFAVEARALEVSGLDPRSEMFRDAPALRPALRYLAERLPADSVLCGHNVKTFDARFLRGQYKLAKIDLPSQLAEDAAVIDTLPIAKEAQRRGCFAREEAALQATIKDGKKARQSCSLGPLVALFNARREAAKRPVFDPSKAPKQAADKHGRTQDEGAATQAHRALADARMSAFIYGELLALEAANEVAPQLALAAGGER